MTQAPRSAQAVRFSAPGARGVQRRRALRRRHLPSAGRRQRHHAAPPAEPAKPKFRMKTRCELWFGFGLESALRTITVSLAEAALRSGALEFLSPC